MEFIRKEFSNSLTAYCSYFAQLLTLYGIKVSNKLLQFKEEQ